MPVCIPAVALSATKLVLVAPAEAGLRSFNRKMPAGINWVLNNNPPTLQFAPPEAAIQNIQCEGIFDGWTAPESVMYDTLSFHYEVGAIATSGLRRYPMAHYGYAYCHGAPGPKTRTTQAVGRPSSPVVPRASFSPFAKGHR